MVRKTVSVMVLMLLLTSLLSSTANIRPVRAGPTTIIVPDDYSAIQEAVNHVNSGDTIYVRAGTYYENVVVNKTISLIGENKVGAIIDANHVGDVIYVTASNVNIAGFTFRNSGPSGGNHGIELQSTFNNNIFDNIVLESYAGIVLYSSSYNNVFGNTVLDNYAHGVLVYFGSGQNNISENILSNNGNGISLYSENDINYVSGNTIVDNDAGLLLYFGLYNKVYHNNFINNSVQAVDPWFPDSPHVFDNGYSSGGNYWSDYTGNDTYSGPCQNETGSDGIGDTPHTFPDFPGGQDRYPLKKPWAAESPWPMFQHDPQHTGRSPYVGPSHSPEAVILLGNQTVDEFFCSPTIGSDGTLYLGAALLGGKHGLFAFYPDGVQKWCCGTGGGTPPALCESDKTVYTHNDVEILAVNTDNGDLRWNYSFAVQGYLAVAKNGILYSTGFHRLPDYSYRSYLIGLDENGEEILSYDIGESSHTPSSPTIDKEGTIYVGYNDTLFAINPDGTEKWRRTFEADIKYHPSPQALAVTTPSIADDGTIYVVVLRESDWETAQDRGYSNHLHAIDPENPGEDKWTYGLRSNWPQNPAIDSEGNVYVINWYYVVGSSGLSQLVVFTPQGSVKARENFRGYGHPSLLLIDAESTAYALRMSIYGTAYLHIFDSEGNQTVTDLPLQEGHRRPLLSLSSDGTLYIGGHKNLYAVKSTIAPPTPDFMITASPDSLNIPQSSSDTSTITVTSINGFNQPVQLSVSGAPSEVTATLNPEQVTPPADCSTTSILTVSVDTTATLGGYTLTLTGTNGTLTHDVDISLEVTVSENQLPVANFDYFPTEPKAGEEVSFDASSSYDLDGEIVAYEWDWNGDGIYEDYTDSSTAFWWMEDGNYQVGLKVIDNDLGIDVTTEEITISKSSASEVKVILAGWFDWVHPWWWFHHGKFVKIDRWLRTFEPDSQALDWLKGTGFEDYEEVDVVHVLDKEIDPVRAPGLAYETYALNAIYEEQLVNTAWKQTTPTYNYLMQPLLKYAFGSIWDLFISEEAIIDLAPYLGVGVSTMRMASKVFDLKDLFREIEKTKYSIALGTYFRYRWLWDQNEAWSLAEPSARLSIDPSASQDEKTKILEDTRWYFEELWQKYGGDEYYEPYQGLPEEFRQQCREDLRALLLSALGKYAYELANREIVKEVASPIELRVYDSDGNVTGIVNGEVREEIPNSVYDEETKTVKVFWPTDSLRYEVLGTGVGSYAFEVTSFLQGNIRTFVAIDIPTSANATHRYTIDWNALSQGEKGVTVQLDLDCDGMFEYAFTSDSQLTQSEYLAAMSGPVPVGGFWVPIDKFELLAPWITLASLLTVATASIVYVKHRRKKQD